MVLIILTALYTVALPMLNSNIVGKVCLLEFTEIAKVLFMPHHRHCHQLGNQWNNKRNSGIQDNYCSSVIQDRCCNNESHQWPWLTFLEQCVTTVTSVQVAAVCCNTDLRSRRKRKSAKDTQTDMGESVRCSLLMLQVKNT